MWLWLVRCGPEKDDSTRESYTQSSGLTLSISFVSNSDVASRKVQYKLSKRHVIYFHEIAWKLPESTDNVYRPRSKNYAKRRRNVK